MVKPLGAGYELLNDLTLHKADIQVKELLGSPIKYKSYFIWLKENKKILFKKPFFNFSAQRQDSYTVATTS